MAEKAELKQQLARKEAELTRAQETISREQQQNQEMKGKVQEMEQKMEGMKQQMEVMEKQVHHTCQHMLSLVHRPLSGLCTQYRETFVLRKLFMGGEGSEDLINVIYTCKCQIVE